MVANPLLNCEGQRDGSSGQRETHSHVSSVCFLGCFKPDTATAMTSMTLDRKEGLTERLITPDTEPVFGVGLVGPGAAGLIPEEVLGLEMTAPASDLKLPIHRTPDVGDDDGSCRGVLRAEHARLPAEVHVGLVAGNSRIGPV